MSLILLGILNAQADGGGGAAAYDLLETQILTSSASSVTFTGLDTLAAGYQHLQIRAVLAQTENSHEFKIRVNGDSTAGKYRSHYIWGNGSSVASDNTNVTYFEIKQGIPRLSASGYGTDVDDSFNAIVTDFLDFSSTTKNTTVRSLYGFHEAGGLGQGVGLASGGWFDTSAITSITYEPAGGTFVTGCRLSLYGVKG